MRMDENLRTASLNFNFPGSYKKECIKITQRKPRGTMEKNSGRWGD